VASPGFEVLGSRRHTAPSGTCTFGSRWIVDVVVMVS
jgi:hypothetical protein